jgi:hypothetical protein
VLLCDDLHALCCSADVRCVVLAEVLLCGVLCVLYCCVLGMLRYWGLC